MALPVIRTFSDCADWSKTVSPYIGQLYDLPQNVFESITNPQALKVLYVSTNPLISGFAFSCFLFPIFLFVSEANRNYSQVDRVWSILPTIYNAHYALYAHAVGLPTQRLDTITAISLIWSARLTYNYWRKGGYSIGSEDYRWNIIKDHINAPLFFILNVVFISSLQSTLLFLITTPTYILLLATKGPSSLSTISDTIFPSFIGFLIFVAYYADGQQWDFHRAKNEYQSTAKVPVGHRQQDLDRGFNTTGLWAYSRHPNFAAEQSVWVTLYAWSVWSSKTYYNWTIAGAISYLLLFQGSTWLTELISARKYPEYTKYQKVVGKFLPWSLNNYQPSIDHKDR